MVKRLLLLTSFFCVVCWLSLSTLAQNIKPIAKPDTKPQQEDNVVKVKTELVTVLASVTDQKGNVVNTLTKDDFELMDNNIPQEVVTLARENTAPLRLVVLFDTSSSVKPKLKFQQQAATKFFKSVLRPTDQAALMSFNQDVMVEQNFTSDTEVLLNATRSLKAKGTTALYDAIYLASKQLEKTQGRHVIVIISDGANIVSRTTLETALKTAEKVDAVIYGIYTAVRLDEFGATAGDKELEKICDRTGGEVFFPKEVNDLDESFARLTSILRAQYVLTFYPNTEEREGGYRLIKVNVKDPNLKIRARRGYYAAKD
jgi:Ca-activated chloride channel family protein